MSLGRHRGTAVSAVDGAVPAARHPSEHSTDGATVNQQQPILIPDLQELRARLLGAGEPAQLYAQVREVARYSEMGYPLWRFLCRMIEPGTSFETDMGSDLLALAGRGSWRSQYTLDVHTWIGAAALGRLAIYLDWTLEQGRIPARKWRALADEMLDVMEQSILPVLRERIPSSLEAGQTVPLPNQGAALLFAAAAVGDVLGHRRARNPSAREMAEESQDLFETLMSHLRPDGYDGEGPVYQLNVQASSLGLTCAILEQSTGRDLFDEKFGPARHSLRHWFETTCFGMMSPNGLMRPIDDYGYARPSSILGFSYAAGRSGDLRFLAPVHRYGLWDAQQCMWDTDDRTLSLLFLPESSDVPETEQLGLLPDSFAFLRTDRDNGTEALVTWKPCERLPYTHAHTDPGNIVLEHHGIPLVLDGRSSAVSGAPLRGSPYCRLFVGTNTDYFMPFRFGNSDIRDQGAAALGPHNTIVIDKRYELPLDEPAGGKLLAWDETGDFTRLLIDAAAPYQSCFDLESFLREVILYRNGVCVVRDELAASSPHTFTWRMHLRPEVEEQPDGGEILTREGVRMSLRVQGRSRLQMQRIEGYPGALEGHCMRAQMCARGKRARFSAAFWAEDLREELVDLTDGWRVREDPLLVGFEKGWPNGRYRGKGAISLSRMPSISGFPECVGNHVWFTRAMPVLDTVSGGTVYLELTPPLSPIRVWLDGRPVPIEHGSWDERLPVRIPLGGASEVSGGRLVLLIRDLPTTRPPAPVRLVQLRKPTGTELRLSRNANGSLSVGHGRWHRTLPARILH